MYQYIPFKNLPRQSTLFLKYLDQDPAVTRFYPTPPTLDSLTAAASTLAASKFPRREMAAILRRQNRLFGADTAVFRQIDELEKPDSVAVVTGQQTGIFIGPLYTIYKALTAVELAASLRRRGVNAVPVFWMETEDHDFREATKCSVLTAEGSAQGIDFGEKLFSADEVTARSVGSIRFSETIRGATREFITHLPDSDRKAEVVAKLESTYVPGVSFAEAFARSMHQLLPETGLILCNPADAEVKQLLSPVFLHAISAAGHMHTALIKRNEELREAGFHTQVQVLENSTTLFLTVAGKRHALERCGEKVFRLKNGDREFAQAELEKLAAQQPEMFSPNVLLRPIVQDTLFPTVAYAGGAAEVAYFAQIETLYQIFNRPMPAIWPRDAFTMIEPEIAEIMNRMGTGFQDLFLEKQELAKKTLCRSGLPHAIENLERLHDRLDRELAALRADAGRIEARLDSMTDTVRRKILHNVQYLKSRVIQLETTRNGSDTQDLAGDIDMVLNHLLPNGNLQERELTIFHFLAQYGPAVIKNINNAIAVETFSHRLCSLP